jgi:hypothetical protein
MTEAELEVWHTVQDLNRVWTSGRVDALDRFFHKDMVAITPMDRKRLEGKAACVASWKRFVGRAAIHEWRERDPLVKIFGDAAVVTYYYDLACELGGERVRLSGRDMFFLVRQDGRWLAVADQFSELSGD